MATLLLVLPLLALSLPRGEAIRCYVCSSSRDPTCKDPFHTSQHVHKLTECTQDNMRNIGDTLPGVFSHFGYHSSQPEDFVCVKAVTREYDKEQVVRSCSIPRADTFDVCSQLKSRDMVSCQTCDRDSCNGVQGLAPGAVLWALLPAVALALFGSKY